MRDFGPITHINQGNRHSWGDSQHERGVEKKRRSLWKQSNGKSRHNWCKMPPRDAQEAEQMARAVGEGELTGNLIGKLRFPKAERRISETTSIPQVIFVLVPEDISELMN